MNYFKAEITLLTENLWLDKKSGQYEGCDPDTYQDLGVVYTFTGTLEKIKDQICKTITKLESWEFNEVNTTLIWSCEGEHDYRTPTSERVPFLENYTLYLTEVKETKQDPRRLQNLPKL